MLGPQASHGAGTHWLEPLCHVDFAEMSGIAASAFVPSRVGSSLVTQLWIGISKEVE